MGREQLFWRRYVKTITRPDLKLCNIVEVSLLYTYKYFYIVEMCFDKVPHSRLLLSTKSFVVVHFLQGLGIDGQLLDWNKN